MTGLSGQACQGEGSNGVAVRKEIAQKSSAPEHEEPAPAVQPRQ